MRKEIGMGNRYVLFQLSDHIFSQFWPIESPSWIIRGMLTFGYRRNLKDQNRKGNGKE